ncbi:MAG: hypothetical protein WAW41_03825 [Methylobacter sp.]
MQDLALVVLLLFRLCQLLMSAFVSGELVLSTHKGHLDMDLSFPIPVIGKVALSIHY